MLLDHPVGAGQPLYRCTAIFRDHSVTVSRSIAQSQARVAELIRPANGSSQPWFCILDDASSWLVKFAGAGPGREALLAEHVANSLGRLWNLPIPESKPVLLDSSVPRAGTDEFWDVLTASEGSNLAIRTIPNAVNLTPNTQLPRAAQELMLAFDLLLVNWDRSAQSRNLLRDVSGQLWSIDHGSCRFLHHLQSQARPNLPSTHFLFDSRDELTPQPLPMLDDSSIYDVLSGVPESWLEAAGRDRSSLGEQLVEYLRRELSGSPRPPGGISGFARNAPRRM